jgi:hypothetical protein
MKKLDNSGFIVADFLFAFVMVIGVGIFIFGFTFSLATIEVAQYIVWSTARNYSAANNDVNYAEAQARVKFNNLAAKFPLLTGSGSDAPWFELKEESLVVGDLGVKDTELGFSGTDLVNRYRQPWTGVRAKLNLKLFASLQIPFLGKVAEDKSLFEFPVRAFIIRNPSQFECQRFFSTPSNRFQAIKELENGKVGPSFSNIQTIPDGNSPYGEDNGC